MSGRGSDESPGMMQCPIGHPPGPQAFCPICGRQCIPVESEAVAPPPEPSDELPEPPAAPPAETPAAPPAEPAAAPAREVGPPADADVPGSAAAKARELIAQLSAGTAGEPAAPTIPSQGPATPPVGGAAPVTPYLPGDTAVPSFPSVESPPPFERTSMAGLGFPTADAPQSAGERAPGSGQWVAPGGTGVEPPPTDADGAHGRRPNRLLPIVLLIAVLLGGGYLVKTQLLDSDSDSGKSAQRTAQPSAQASASPQASPQPSPSAAASLAPTPVPSYTDAQLAAQLKNSHFKHGYDAGKARVARSGAVAPADRESVCRTMALAARAKGYPWGQHDQVGCLVALSRA